MTRVLAIAVIIGVALAIVLPGAGQEVVLQRNLSLDLASLIAEATLAECKSRGFETAAVVVDRAGQPIVMIRSEAATAQMMEMARRKAYTARMFRTNTLDILALGGGIPIRVGDEIIGGVGSSGSSQETDDACAAAGVEAAGEFLRD